MQANERTFVFMKALKKVVWNCLKYLTVLNACLESSSATASMLLTIIFTWFLNSWLEGHQAMPHVNVL